MYLRKIMLCAISMIAIIAVSIFFTAAPQTGIIDHSRDPEAELAVKQLWSADSEERQAAKEKIIQLGPKAIPSLIALLEDLAQNPGLRFVPGKEEEGRKAWRHYMNLPIEQRDDRAYLGVRKLEISARLREDVYELLGRLKAEEAVPFLIDIMKKDFIASAGGKMRSEMRALVEIGSAAVPKLIEAIETAEVKATSKAPANVPTDDVKQGMIERDIFVIQSRAAMVLGEIGDSRALPILEKLSNATQNKFLVPYVKSAIEKIQKKQAS